MPGDIPHFFSVRETALSQERFVFKIEHALSCEMDLLLIIEHDPDKKQIIMIIQRTTKLTFHLLINI